MLECPRRRQSRIGRIGLGRRLGRVLGAEEQGEAARDALDERLVLRREHREETPGDAGEDRAARVNVAVHGRRAVEREPCRARPVHAVDGEERGGDRRAVGGHELPQRVEIGEQVAVAILERRRDRAVHERHQGDAAWVAQDQWLRRRRERRRRRGERGEENLPRELEVFQRAIEDEARRVVRVGR